MAQGWSSISFSCSHCPEDGRGCRDTFLMLGERDKQQGGGTPDEVEDFGARHDETQNMRDTMGKGLEMVPTITRVKTR